LKKIFNFSKSNYKIILIFFIFLFSLGITSGVYLNKVYPISNSSIVDYISRTTSYYEGSFDVLKLTFLNFKNDIIYLLSMYLCSLMVFTCPLVLVIVFLKGLSIGYTINTVILILKMSSFKIVLLTLIKNILIVPFSFFVIILSFNYFLEAVSAIKICNRFKSLNHMKKLITKYSINVLTLFLVVSILQSLVNVASIFIIQRIF
jgi:stage II sporulation protein M